MKIEIIKLYLKDMNEKLVIIRNILNISPKGINTLTQKYKCCNNYVSKHKHMSKLYNEMINIYNNLLQKVENGTWILDRKYDSKLIELFNIIEEFENEVMVFEVNIGHAIKAIEDQPNKKAREEIINFIQRPNNPNTKINTNTNTKTTRRSKFGGKKSKRRKSFKKKQRKKLKKTKNKKKKIIL
jgi:hypothetical protein